MEGVAIYMEGGGDGPNGKAALRIGMDALLSPLKEVARRDRLRWKLVVCGGRDAAFKRFRNAANGGETIVALLVDSEGPVSTAPTLHLAQRDGWHLQFADGDAIHLMVQVMETWIVADVDALSGYYGADSSAIGYLTAQCLRRCPKPMSQALWGGPRPQRQRAATARSGTPAICLPALTRKS